MYRFSPAGTESVFISWTRQSNEHEGILAFFSTDITKQEPEKSMTLLDMKIVNFFKNTYHLEVRS